MLCIVKFFGMNPVKAFTLIALGLAIAAMGIYVADADDAGARHAGHAIQLPSVDDD